MADNLTDAQKVISKVHRLHLEVFDGFTQRHVCTCEKWDQEAPFDHSEHVSVEVDKALGGLTREWAIRSQAYNDTSMTGDLEDLIDEIDLFSADHRIESRVVGDWMAEEEP